MKKYGEVEMRKDGEMWTCSVRGLPQFFSVRTQGHTIAQALDRIREAAGAGNVELKKNLKVVFIHEYFLTEARARKAVR